MPSPESPIDPRFPVRWRHLPVVLAAVLALVAAGVVVVRQDQYEAESRLLVGTFEADSAQIAGYVLATETLARNYDRLASSGAVLEPLAERLDIPLGDLRDRVSVAAVPDSSVIRVIATGTDPEEARRISEATAEEIVSSVTAMSADTGEDDLLVRHRQAASDLAEATLEQSRLQTVLGELRVDEDATAAEVESAARQLQEAEIAVNEARLRVDGIASRYLEGQRQATTAGDARVLGPALVSEESQLVDALLALAVGALAGWFAGHGVLALVARRNRTDRRATTPPRDQRPLVASP